MFPGGGNDGDGDFGEADSRSRMALLNWRANGVSIGLRSLVLGVDVWRRRVGRSAAATYITIIADGVQYFAAQSGGSC